MHIASLAGVWVALVEGLGGLRVVRDVLTLAPALREAITRLAFRVRWCGTRLLVQVGDDEVRSGDRAREH